MPPPQDDKSGNVTALTIALSAGVMSARFGKARAHQRWPGEGCKRLTPSPAPWGRPPQDPRVGGLQGYARPGLCPFLAVTRGPGCELSARGFRSPRFGVMCYTTLL